MEEKSGTQGKFLGIFRPTVHWKKCLLAGMRSTWALEKTAQHQLQAKLQYGEVESDGVNFSKGKFPETIGVRTDGPY